MNEPTCTWSKKLADNAVQFVRAVVETLISKGIPSQTFTLITGDGEKAKPFGPAVSRKRILSVFNWIISETKGFRIPLRINFRYGDAPTIAWGIIKSCDPMLSNELYALENAGLHVPRVSFASHGNDAPVMMVSNLSRTKGNLGCSLDGIKTINIYGEMPKPERIVLLENIPS